MALKEWRTAESEVRNLKAQISNFSDLVAARETALVEGRMCGQQSCSNKPEGASTLSVCLDHKSPSINIESSVTTCEQQEQCPIDSKVSAKWEYLVCPMNYGFYRCGFQFCLLSSSKDLLLSRLALLIKKRIATQECDSCS
jgi:hypothetical protein